VIDGTGIPTAAVFQLFNTGDSIAETAEEYDRTPNEIDIAGRLLIQAMRVPARRSWLCSRSSSRGTPDPVCCPS
jgi:hypothetical protein